MTTPKPTLRPVDDAPEKAPETASSPAQAPAPSKAKPAPRPKPVRVAPEPVSFADNWASTFITDGPEDDDDEDLGAPGATYQSFTLDLHTADAQRV